MFLYFKDLRIHFIVSSLLGGVVVGCVAYIIMRLLFVPVAACVLIALSYMLLWTIFRRTMVERRGSERFMAATRLRMDECRLQDYLHFYEILLSQNKEKRRQRRILLNMSTGYLEIGEDAQAKAILDELTAYFAMHTANTNKIVYFDNMVTYYLHMRDLEAAKKVMVMYKQTLNDPALSSQIKASHKPLYEDKEAWIKLLEGKADEVLDFYLELLEASPHQLTKVHAHDMLAIIYRQLNRPDLALASKVYLIKYGGDLACAKRARLEMNNAGT